jgi:glycosyltransferase involved in cell wall biosynthesis
MRIGINIDQILYRISGGTGRYSWNLIKSLAEIDNRNSYVLFHSRTHSKNLAVIEELNLGSNFSLRQLPFSRPLASSVWSRARFWPLGFFLGRLDLVHAPTFAIPAKGSAKLVVTVHDLAFLKFPEFYTARSLKFHQRSARIAASEADLLIAVSNSTKEDIISLLSVDEKRVKVIYEGVEIDKSRFCWALASKSHIFFSSARLSPVKTWFAYCRLLPH